MACELSVNNAHVTAGNKQKIINPVLCFSLLAPAQLISGGELIESTGGFSAVQLNGELSIDNPLSFIVAYADDQLKAANRAWLPLGVYLRLSNGKCEPVNSNLIGVHALPANVNSKQETPTKTHSFHSDKKTEQRDNNYLKLVPQPTRWEPEGSTLLSFKQLLITDNSSGNAQFESINALAQRCQFEPLITDNTIHTGIINTQISFNKTMNTASYSLYLPSNGNGNGNIIIETADEQGLFYALISLLNLRATYNNKLPSGFIFDDPRYAWRGQHLDCARHFFKHTTIKRLLDLMSLLKLNRFHWHFSDDEAFRVEVESEPALWQKTAYRGENQCIPGVFAGGAGPTGGSYNKACVSHIIQHAKQLHIEVLPEIEFPAHALCISHVFPNLLDPNDAGQNPSVQGYSNNVVNPAVEDTLPFFKQLAVEIAELFPFSHLHIGGDEMPENAWQLSPIMQAYKSQHQLTSTADIQGFAMQQIADSLSDAGIQACAWEESQAGNHGGIGNQAILFAWKGELPPGQQESATYRWVHTPAQHVYFDMAHTSSEDDWGANWAATISLADTIDWDPASNNNNDHKDDNRDGNGNGKNENTATNKLLHKTDNTLGIQGAFWAEFTSEDVQMEAMLAPRILGLACKAWSPRDAINTAVLYQLASDYETVFDSMQWQRAPKGLY